MKKKYTLIFIICLISAVNITGQSFHYVKAIDMNIVKNVNLNKYAGTWYEIARFPHSFEKNLVGVTATYTLTDGKFIKVLNQGYKKTLDGPLKKANGKAYVPDKSVSGHLKVSFFLWFYADYFIFELDEENYTYALIGSSSMNYLWILCQTPQMDEDTYQMLVEKAKNRGYDITKLQKVAQKIQK